MGCEKKISSVCLLLDTFSCPMMTDGRTCVHKKSRLLSYDWLESRSNSSSHTPLLLLVLCEHCCCWDAVSHILKQWKPKQNCQQWWLLLMLMLLFIFKQSLECSFSQICKLNRKRKCIIHIRHVLYHFAILFLFFALKLNLGRFLRDWWTVYLAWSFSTLLNCRVTILRVFSG